MIVALTQPAPAPFPSGVKRGTAFEVGGHDPPGPEPVDDPIPVKQHPTSHAHGIDPALAAQPAGLFDRETEQIGHPG